MSRVVDALRQFVTPEQTPSTVDEAIDALEPFRDETVPGLIEALEAGDIMLQLLALQIIQEIGPKATNAVPAVITKLQSTDRCVHLAAVAALGAVGTPAKDALPRLLVMLDSDDEYTRFVAADAMVHIESHSERAMSVLVEVLNNKTSPHRLFAAMTLGDLGHEDAVPDLKKLLDDKDGGVRSEASLAIWKITGDASDAESVGRSLLNDSDWLVRQMGAEHFEQLGITA